MARWPLVLLRGVPLVLLVFGGLGVLLLVRLIELPLWGSHRPWTPRITQFVCRVALRLLGLRLTVEGQAMAEHGALVANHSSWLDIFVLNACDRVYFVSKAEVAGWAGIGWLARATGTVFIERRRSEARRQREVLQERLGIGHKLLFFPEGTSTDGLRVLPFKSTLFEALFAANIGDLHVQPVTVTYRAPAGQDPRFYGWWGEMDFVPHLIWLLATPKSGEVRVRFHGPLAIDQGSNRKDMAAVTGRIVADDFAVGRG